LGLTPKIIVLKGAVALHPASFQFDQSAEQSALFFRMHIAHSVAALRTIAVCRIGAAYAPSSGNIWIRSPSIAG
jgi:hypothetical protein